MGTIILDAAEVVPKMHEAYSKLDLSIRETTAAYPVTCRRGCSHCCEILMVPMIPEAVVLADAVLKLPYWRAIARVLKKHARVLCDAQLTHDSFFQRKMSCPLLDKKTGDCAVYESRPSACRCHYVISPPEDCARREEPRPLITAVNLKPLEATIWKKCTELLPAPIFAPLPISVLWCMSMLKEDKLLKQLTRNMPSPMEWLELMGPQMEVLAEEAKGRPGEYP